LLWFCVSSEGDWAMSTTVITAGVIQASASITLRYAEAVPNGIDAADFGKKARIGGEVIDGNTPAFVYGHLALYPSRVVEFAGLDAAAVTPSEAWVKLFSDGEPCHDDPDGTIYPAKDELVSAAVEAQRAAIDAVASMDEASLARPNPSEGGRARLPTVGDAANFYLSGHAMMHLGQLSFWRRVMGVGSIF
ncbi:MAG: DinB family protein, partial [Planctomycetota bacterium]